MTASAHTESNLGKTDPRLFFPYALAELHPWTALCMHEAVATIVVSTLKDSSGMATLQREMYARKCAGKLLGISQSRLTAV